MITSYLTGGIGNQLFQVAAGYSLSLDLKSNFFLNYYPNPKNWENSYNQNLYDKTMFRKFKKTDNDKFEKYNQMGFSFKPIPRKRNLCLIGYFQSEKFFLNHFNEIRELYTFPKSISEQIDKKLKKIKKKKIAVHIRWGSYKKTMTILPTLPKEYFEMAIEQIKEKYKDFELIFFSDNPKEVKKQFKSHNYTFLNNNNDIEDLYAISQCDSVIMSNSTFSWWGSWLGKKKDVVIYPKPWFGIMGPLDVNDICPKKWIEINYV